MLFQHINSLYNMVSSLVACFMHQQFTAGNWIDVLIHGPLFPEFFDRNSTHSNYNFAKGTEVNTLIDI